MWTNSCFQHGTKKFLLNDLPDQNDGIKGIGQVNLNVSYDTKFDNIFFNIQDTKFIVLVQIHFWMKAMLMNNHSQDLQLVTLNTTLLEQCWIHTSWLSFQLIISNYTADICRSYPIRTMQLIQWHFCLSFSLLRNISRWRTINNECPNSFTSILSH